MQHIDLIPEDDITSINDRLDWAADSRVLLVLPDDGQLLANPLDLARLRRKADRLRLEVGLVTLDPRVRRQAGDYGLPVFHSVNQAERAERRWRRGRRQRERSGLTPEEIRETQLDAADRREIRRRRTGPSTLGRWLRRYAAITGFCLTAAVVAVAVAYAVPGGRITITPYTAPIRVEERLVADPLLENANLGGASIPARVLVVEAEWRTEVATTGTIEVPDAPARGKVVFVNQIDQPVAVPAGTRVTTTAGEPRQVFETVLPVNVPGLVRGTVEADIIAVEPGPGGNVAANQINRIEGPLNVQLAVRNLEETAGGGVRAVPAVSEADIDRLRAQVTQYLQNQAAAQMASQLEDSEFLAADSVRMTRIDEETLSHFPGQPTPTVAVQVRAVIQGTAVDTNQALDIVYNNMVGAIEPGFHLVPESFDFYSGEVLAVDGEGRVQFEMVGEGLQVADIDVAPFLDDVAGQPVEPAMTYLYERLPLRARPSAEVFPNWFGRLPYLPARIQVESTLGEVADGG